MNEAQRYQAAKDRAVAANQALAQLQGQMEERKARRQRLEETLTAEGVSIQNLDGEEARVRGEIAAYLSVAEQEITKVESEVKRIKESVK